MKCFSMIVMLLVVLLAGCASSSHLHEPDPIYDEAKRAMNHNEYIGMKKLQAYTSLIGGQVKAGKISKKEYKALFELKMAEVSSEVTRANAEVLDRYQRSKASDRSFTCFTTASSNSTFTTCN